MICRRAAARDRARGFTLIEVLVAMTILAVGVSTLVVSAASSAARADTLRNREMARWVASNTLSEWQAISGWPDIGTTNTEVEMARRRWFIRTRTQKVADADLRRLDIEVRDVKDSDNYLYTVTGFAGNPEMRR